MIVVPVVVPFAFSPAFFPLFFELAAALLGLAAALTVVADGLVESLFRLVDFSLAFVVSVMALGLHGKHSAKQQECGEQGRKGSTLFQIHTAPHGHESCAHNGRATRMVRVPGFWSFNCCTAERV